MLARKTVALPSMHREKGAELFIWEWIVVVSQERQTCIPKHLAMWSHLATHANPRLLDPRRMQANRVTTIVITSTTAANKCQAAHILNTTDNPHSFDV